MAVANERDRRNVAAVGDRRTVNDDGTVGP